MFAPKGKKVDESVLEILKLNINEGMVIRPQDWKLRASPQTYFYANQDKFNGIMFKVRKIANNDGWAILRIS